MKIMMAQCTPRVGDIDGNVAMIDRYIQQARESSCHLIIFPELAVTGYPPEDLLLLPAFMQEVTLGLRRIQNMAQGIAVLVGFPFQFDSGLRNSLTVFQDGQALFHYDKCCLPNYGVFDERRYFEAGSLHQPLSFELNGEQVGVAICEDLWDSAFAARMQQHHVNVWVTINASPFHLEKQMDRERLTSKRAKETGVDVVYLNALGGQDEVVFDGGSHIACKHGTVLRCGQFAESAQLFNSATGLCSVNQLDLMASMEQLYAALVLGLRDYVRRNGLTQVVLGLSGGIDSALTAVIAADALGPNQVLGVLLPSSFSSEHSIHDAESLVGHLGIQSTTLPILPVVQSVEHSLEPLFAAWGYGGSRDVCEENIQARSRGLLLMAISNKTGRMLLTTGNKSELAVGYATLYGDMCGAFSVLKDVYKSQVFDLANWVNRESMTLHQCIRIPQNSIDKPPSAELAPDQKDADSLPDYAVLDAILFALIEQHQGVAEIVAQGFDHAVVQRIEKMLHMMEFKRRQAPPGVKVSPCAFGRDRRFPMTHSFRSSNLNNS